MDFHEKLAGMDDPFNHNDVNSTSNNSHGLMPSHLDNPVNNFNNSSGTMSHPTSPALRNQTRNFNVPATSTTSSTISSIGSGSGNASTSIHSPVIGAHHSPAQVLSKESSPLRGLGRNQPTTSSSPRSSIRLNNEDDNINDVSNRRRYVGATLNQPASTTGGRDDPYRTGLADLNTANSTTFSHRK